MHYSLASSQRNQIVNLSSLWPERLIVWDTVYHNRNTQWAANKEYPPAFMSAFSLLYVAGLCYQWLKSDIIAGGKELRSGELLLLKVWNSLTGSTGTHGAYSINHFDGFQYN